jgi:4-azaleucine resistance transporter AzlC
MSDTLLSPNPTGPAPDPFRAYRRGILVALPMQLATAPFGVIFGALAIEVGLDAVQTMAMTVIVVAGASQLVALQMLAEQAPPLMIVLTATVVNLRMAMYSAAIAARWQGVGPRPRLFAAWFLNDQSFALSVKHYDQNPSMPPSERVGFFFGVGSCTLTFWITATLIGAVVGAQLPPEWPLEFAVPVVFISISAPMLRGMPNLAAALSASTLAIVLHDLPHGLGLIAASIVGIAVGMVLTEARR